MSSTALQAVQNAAVKLGLAQPDALFSSTDRTDIELRRALIEASDRIVHAHDWSALLTVETHEGDGSATEFALPSDYLRMPKDAQVWSTKWESPLPAISPEEWLNLDVRSYNVVHGVWTIYGGNVVYKPALDSDEDAKFWYVSDKVVTDADTTTKATFDADTDTFRLDDRVLELMLIAHWRKQKGLDYSEEMMDAEIALARAIDRDKGARIVTQKVVTDSAANLAYPRAYTP